MAEMKKWHTAFLAGVILIIPVIFVYQLYLQPDIVIDTGSFGIGCNVDGTVCSYSTDKVNFEFVETETDWRILGDCVDTAIQDHYRKQAIADRDDLQLIAIFPSDPNECRNLAVFERVDWNLSVGGAVAFGEQGESSYQFTLKDVKSIGV